MGLGSLHVMSSLYQECDPGVLQRSCSPHQKPQHIAEGSIIVNEASALHTCAQVPGDYPLDGEITEAVEGLILYLHLLQITQQHHRDQLCCHAQYTVYIHGVTAPLIISSLEAPFIYVLFFLQNIKCWVPDCNVRNFPCGPSAQDFNDSRGTSAQCVWPGCYGKSVYSLRAIKMLRCNKIRHLCLFSQLIEDSVN